MKKSNYAVLKQLVNRSFTFGDLDSRFAGVDSSVGNIFCPFHYNVSTPAAKMYYDETNDWEVIRCFNEGKSFTTYDYVYLILCKSKKQYNSVEHFLRSKLGDALFLQKYELIEKNLSNDEDSFVQKKIDYINSIYNEEDNLVTYIERLYLGT